MPVLTNTRHERFAQELAQGKTAVEAHRLARYKADDGNASKLAAKPEIQARVQEITGEAAAKVGVTVEAIIEELAKLGFSNMLDYMQIAADGRPFLDFSKLTRDQAAAISELVVETRPLMPPPEDQQEPQGHGGSLRRQRAGDDGMPALEITKVRFKLADKRGALDLLGKHYGLYKERIEHSVDDPLAELLAAISGTAFRPRSDESS